MFRQEITKKMRFICGIVEFTLLLQPFFGESRFNPHSSMAKQEKEIPLLDCPVDYLIGDASGKIMNEYGRFPCKIKCGVYALMVRGTASATINITRYEVKQNDILLLEPNSFLLIHHFSEDALVYYVLFSSSFLEKHAFRDRILLDTLQLRNPLLSVREEAAEVLKLTVELLLKAANTRPSMLNTEVMVNIFNLLQTLYLDFARKHGDNLLQPNDRKEEIYQEFVKLVMKHYHEWHHVNEYAKHMRLSTPHLSSTIRSVGTRAAGEIIDEAILTDAKAQLKLTKLQVKEIAISLGFENVAFFNRFFRLRTNMTPKEYRNSN